MSGTTPRNIKLALAFGFGVATVLFLTHYHHNGVSLFNRNTAVTSQASLSGRVYIVTVKPSSEIKKKSTKCGETDDDFTMAGNEGVKPITDKISAKFRSKDALCAKKKFPKPDPGLSLEETKRKQACVNTWVADHIRHT